MSTSEPRLDGSIPPDVPCPGCGYLLFGSVGDKCTECGYDISRMRRAESGIPWVHRRERGRFISFWQTVWLVTIRHRRFCEEYARDVSYADARRFQWVVVLHVFVPVVLAVVATYWMTPPDLSKESFMAAMMLGRPPRQPTSLDYAYAEVWPVAMLLACFLLWLVAATGAPSYFFHPKSIPVRRQNSAVAMSYYCAAPLALLPGNLLLVVVLIEGFVNFGETEPLAYLWMGGCALVAHFGGTSIMALNLMRRLMPERKRLAVSFGMALPIVWAGLGVLIMAGLPIALLFALVGIDGASP